MFIGFETSLADIPQQRWLDSFAAHRPFILRSNDMMTQIQTARSVVGVALLPRFIGDAQTDLVKISIGPEPPERKLWMSVHADTRHSSAIRAEIAFLIEICGNLPGR